MAFSHFISNQLNYFLFNIEKNPSPDTYKINSLFNPNATTSTFTNHMKGSKTYSFGTGREEFGSTVVNTPKPYYIGADKKNPGPQ